jgi:spore germination protein GerM
VSDDPTGPVPLHGPQDDETARLLRRALTQEADMVHPDDRLGSITDRIEEERRPRWVPVLAAVAGVAVVALGAGLALGLGDDDPVNPAATSPSTQTDASTTEPAPTTTEAETPEPSTVTEEPPAAQGDDLPVYWVGEQGSRFALFREFGEPGPTDPEARAQAAVDAALDGSPADADYSAPWPDGAAASTSLGADEIAIDLNAAAADGSSIGSELALTMVQQLVWTVTAAVQQDVSVRITVDGEAVDLFGAVSTDEPISRATGMDDPRGLVWITTPVEGGTLEADAPEFSGQGVNAFENTLGWTLERDGAVVEEGFFGVSAPDGEPVDAGERGEWTLQPEQPLEPGEYSLTVEVPDASDGESTIRHFDTKTFSVS